MEYFHWKFLISFFFFNFKSFPFNTKTLSGYVVAFAVECIMLWNIFCFALCIVSFVIGTFQFLIASLYNLRSYLHRFNKLASIVKNRSLANENIGHFVELQSSAKQLSWPWSFNFWKDAFLWWIFLFLLFRLMENSSELYQPIVAFTFLWCIGIQYTI